MSDSGDVPVVAPLPAGGKLTPWWSLVASWSLLAAATLGTTVVVRTLCDEARRIPQPPEVLSVLIDTQGLRALYMRMDRTEGGRVEAPVFYVRDAVRRPDGGYDEASLRASLHDDDIRGVAGKEGIRVALIVPDDLPPRESLARTLRLFAAERVTVHRAQTKHSALLTFIRHELLARPDAGPVLLLDMEDEATGVVIADGSGAWFARIPVGENHFVRALAKAKGLSFEKAYSYKHNIVKLIQQFEPEYVQSCFLAMQPVSESLKAAIRGQIQSWSVEHPGQSIGRAVAIGRGFQLAGLRKFLGQDATAWGLPASGLEGVTRLPGVDPANVPDWVTRELDCYCAVVGAGLEALGVAPPSESPLHERTEGWRDWLGKLSIGMFDPLIAVALVTLFGLVSAWRAGPVALANRRRQAARVVALLGVLGMLSLVLAWMELELSALFFLTFLAVAGLAAARPITGRILERRLLDPSIASPPAPPAWEPPTDGGSLPRRLPPRLGDPARLASILILVATAVAVTGDLAGGRLVPDWKTRGTSLLAWHESITGLLRPELLLEVWFTGLAAFTWPLLPILRWRRTNAFYLRSFRGDDRTAPLRLAIQQGLGRSFRLSGIRAPLRRTGTFWKYATFFVLGMRYVTVRYMNLEAEGDWLARLWRSLGDARCAFLDLSDLTEYVAAEARMVVEGLGPRRVMFVGDRSRSEADWRALVAERLGLGPDESRSIQVLTWDREAGLVDPEVVAAVRCFAESLPDDLAGPCPRTFPWVVAQSSPGRWAGPARLWSAAAATAGFVAVPALLLLILWVVALYVQASMPADPSVGFAVAVYQSMRIAMAKLVTYAFAAGTLGVYTFSSVSRYYNDVGTPGGRVYAIFLYIYYAFYFLFVVLPLGYFIAWYLRGFR